MITLSLAVVMTCHNRKQKTLSCLEALFANLLPDGVLLDTYLVDDGSTDGTTEAVCQAYPQVHVLQGDGNLFWTGGMQKALTKAIQQQYNFYLWLNDDTILYPTALSTLFETFQKLIANGKRYVIVIGSTQDPRTHTLTYGGLIQHSYFRPLKFSRLGVTDDIQPCHTMNGNCVLIPNEVVKLVGNLDLTFTHYLADYDYGLRARKKGCTLWIVPDYIGTCANDTFERHKVQNPTFSLNHLQLLTKRHPKGIPVGDTFVYSLQEWKVFCQRHSGLLWPIYWLLPYRRLIWLLLKISPLNY